MTTEQLIVYVVLPVVGYLLGSIPFAWAIGKMRGIDIRTVGSKNIGATNLGRTLGKKYFWQAFLLDAAKGFVPVFGATYYISMTNKVFLDKMWEIPANASTFEFFEQSQRLLSAPPPTLPVPYWAPLLTAIACVLGHLFPIWLKFKGGKGVATGFGVVLGFWHLYTVAGLIAGVFFVFMLMVYRYISLASMSAAVLFALLVATLGRLRNPWIPTYISYTSDWLVLVTVAALFALMIILRHRANISRLLAGTEPQIGQREVDKSKMDPPPQAPSA